MRLRFPERRTGFDRRRPEGSPIRRAYHRALCAFREDTGAVIVALLAVAVLNITDLVLTLHIMEFGAVEANPLMDFLFREDPLAAAIIKIGIGLAVVLLLWMMRRYRRVLEATWLLVVAFSALTAWHAYSALALSVT